MTNTQDHRYNSYQGFTLLELLLVIAILGVLATFSLSLYQQETSRFKIEKTALQMQQILQAATAYYTQNNQWPSNCADPNFNNYLPVGSSVNPWGNNYICQPSQEGKKFDVISGDLKSASNAAQVLAILPSAVGYPLNAAQPTQLISEIAIPADLSTQTTGFLLQYLGVLNLTSNEAVIAGPSFTCPAGFQGNAITTPIALHTHDWYFNGLDWCAGRGRGSRAISIINTNPIGCSVTPQPNGQNLYYCNFSVLYQSNNLVSTGICEWLKNQTLGNIQYAIVEYCIPPQKHGNTKPTASF